MSGYYQALRPLSAQSIKVKPMASKKTKPNDKIHDQCIWLMVRAKGALRWRGSVKFTKAVKTVVVKDINSPYQGDDTNVQFVTLEQAKRIYRDPQLTIVKSGSIALLEG